MGAVGAAAAMLDALLEEWRDARGLTLDLLNACSESDLAFTLHPTCGPLWRQFRHIGRVHDEYLSAIVTGDIRFDPAAGRYHGGAAQPALLGYFEDLARRHAAVFAGAAAGATVRWFDEQVSLEIHLTRLLSHEALHHGQLMLFWRALGHAFPKSWEAWGEA